MDDAKGAPKPKPTRGFVARWSLRFLKLLLGLIALAFLTVLSAFVALQTRGGRAFLLDKLAPVLSTAIPGKITVGSIDEARLGRITLRDVVILDPAKMTRDREQVIAALKKYLDMNKLALGVVKPGGLFATFSCTGLVSEEQFLDMLRRAAFYADRAVQVLKVSGAGEDHPWQAHVPESRYLKAAFCRVE